MTCATSTVGDYTPAGGDSYSGGPHRPSGHYGPAAQQSSYHPYRRWCITLPHTYTTDTRQHSNIRFECTTIPSRSEQFQADILCVMPMKRWDFSSRLFKPFHCLYLIFNCLHLTWRSNGYWQFSTKIRGFATKKVFSQSYLYFCKNAGIWFFIVQQL